MPKTNTNIETNTIKTQETVIVSDLENEFSEIRKLTNLINNKCVMGKVTSQRISPRLTKIYELLMRGNTLKSINWNTKCSFTITRHGINQKEQDAFRKVMQRLGFEKFAEFESALVQDYQFKKELLDEHTVQYSHPQFKKHQSSLMRKIKKNRAPKKTQKPISLSQTKSQTSEGVKMNLAKMKYGYSNLQQKVQELKTIKGAEVDMTSVLMKLLNNTKKISIPNAPSRDFYFCILLFHHLQQSSEMKKEISNRFAEDLEISSILDEESKSYLGKMKELLSGPSF